ncbi:MAG: Ig-like domain-containing protein [Pikeienuella sp.]
MQDILWSDFRMPDGSHPGPDDVVIVDSDVRLIFDETDGPVRIKALVVYGEFTVADDIPEPLELTTDWALVAGNGRFEVGTPAEPFEGDFTLTLAGKDTSNTVDLRDYPDGCDTPPDQCPVTGGSTCHCGDADGGHAHHVIENNNAFLMAMGEGATISIHADDAAKESWTQLDGTAEAGATTLTFAAATGWEVGDRIAVASTDFDTNQAEEFTIVAVSEGGRMVTLDRPLEYIHYGQVDIYDDTDGDVHELDMRAEVLLLSRDVTIQGDIDYNDSVPLNEQADQYGGHTMIMHGGEMYISGVEFAYMGQAGVLGSYPVHWHLLDDVSGQYVKNSSVHHSFNKGITVHGTDHAVVDNNAVYETISHGIYLEGFGNTENEVTDNAVLGVRHVGRFGEIEGAHDDTPSGIYTQDSNNVITGNHVGGSDQHGFYLNFNKRRADFSWGTFEDNTAHTIEGRGIYVNGPVTQDWTVSGFTVYKADQGIYARNSGGVFTDSVFAEMGTNARFRENQTLENSLIVGRSNNKGTPTTDREIEEGRTLPGTHRDDRPDQDNDFEGAQLYDGPGSFRNVMFSDFTGKDNALVGSNSVQNSGSHAVEGLTWNNVDEANKLAFGGGATDTSSFARAILDVDGSLSGTPGALVYKKIGRGATEGFSSGEDYEIRDDWRAVITTSGEQSATVRFNLSGTEKAVASEDYTKSPFETFNLVRSDGERADGIRREAPVYSEYGYELEYTGLTHHEFRIELYDADPDQAITIDLGPLPDTSQVWVVDWNSYDKAQRDWQGADHWEAREVSSMAMLEASPDTAVFRDAEGHVHIKLVAEMSGGRWLQPGVAMTAHSGVTVMVDTSADLDLDALIFDDPVPDDGSGPRPPANADPEAMDDALALEAAATGRIDVIENDSDTDGDTLTVTGLSVPDGLDASVLDDGETIEITAEAGFTGEAVVVYEISDGNGGTDTAEIRVTVAEPAPQNRAPEANPDTLEIDLLGEATVAVLANDTDPDGDELSITRVWASDGLAAVTDGAAVRVVADRSFTGTGTVVYEVEDGRGGTDSAEIAVNLRASEPVEIVLELWDGRDDTLIGTLEDAAVLSLPADTLDALTITARGVGAPVESFSVTLNDVPIGVDNTEPYALFGDNGGDLVGGGLAAGRHSLTVTAYSDNGAGGAVLSMKTIAFDLVEDGVPDELPVPADLAVTLSAGDGAAVTIRADELGEDPEGVALVVSSVAEPEVGRVEIADDGSTLTYVPEPGFVGALELEVAFSEAGAAPGRATTTVTIEVEEADPAEPAAPMFEAAFFTTDRIFDREITPLFDGAVLDAGVFGRNAEATIAIFLAEGAPEIGSLQLVYNEHSQIENTEPYALFGNWGPNYLGGTRFEPGSHELEVTAFAEPDGAGAVLDRYVLEFEVLV